MNYTIIWMYGLRDQALSSRIAVYVARRLLFLVTL